MTPKQTMGAWGMLACWMFCSWYPAMAADGDVQVNNVTYAEETETGVLDDLILTLSHVYACGTSETRTGTISNRSSLRGQMDTALGGGWNLVVDGKALLYLNRDHVARAVGQSVETDGDIRELYIQAGYDRVSFSVGKKVIVWGETDGDVINDVISPRDERECVFTDLEDARLGQIMATMTVYSGWGDLFSFVTLEPGVNRTPDMGTRYDREAPGIAIRHTKPGLSDHEYGGKWKKAFHGFDMSIMAASLRQNSGVLVHDGGLTYKRTYDRYRFYGMGARWARNSVLFTLDASLKQHIALQGMDDLGRYAASHHRVFDSALGIEYDANGRYTLTVELTHRKVMDSDPALTGIRSETSGLFVQYRKLFLNDTLTVRCRLLHRFREKHTLHNAELDYAWSDPLRLIMNYTFFRERNQASPFYSFKDEDRISIEARYCF